MQLRLDEILKAAGEPTRLRILHLLRQQALSVSALQAVLEIPQSTVSRHLATLRHTGLVVAERHGTHTIYSLAAPDEPSLQALSALLARGCCGEGYLQADLARLAQFAQERTHS